MSRVVLPTGPALLARCLFSLLGQLVHPVEELLAAHWTLHVPAFLSLLEDIRWWIEGGVGGVLWWFSGEAVEMLPAGSAGGYICASGEERLSRVHYDYNPHS